MSDLKESIGKAVKGITKGSGQLIKTTSLSIKLSSEESSLKTIYQDIGKSVHEIYKHGGSLGALFDGKYEEILECEARIREIRERLEIAKGTVTCSRCGATSKRGSAFCPKCGEGLEGAVAVAEPPKAAEVVSVPNAPSVPNALGDSPLERGTVPVVPPAPSGKVCGQCGTGNDAGERFCISCARII